MTIQYLWARRAIQIDQEIIRFISEIPVMLLVIEFEWLVRVVVMDLGGGFISDDTTCPNNKCAPLFLKSYVKKACCFSLSHSATTLK